MLSLAVGVVIVVSALLVGFVLGNRAALMTVADPGPIAVKSDPQLEVNMPDGAVLSVDGRAVPGESPVTVPLTAGRSHVVRVTLDDHFPFETAIRLDYNDVRVLTVERGKLHPKSKKNKRKRRR